jgi:hypothetical protein
VLDDIRDIRGLAVDAGLLECAVEKAPGRSYEWPSGEIFVIARLLAHKHDSGARPALAENRLGSTLP